MRTDWKSGDRRKGLVDSVKPFLEERDRIHCSKRSRLCRRGMAEEEEKMLKSLHGSGADAFSFPL